MTPQRKAHPAFRATGGDELDALAARLAAAGLAVQWDGEIPGVRRFYAADPWGNRLEFLTDDGYERSTLTMPSSTRTGYVSTGM